VGEAAARAGIDALAATGPLCAELVDAARSAGLAQARHYATQAELIAALRRALAPGDLILVKGSRGMAMEGVLSVLAQAPAVREER
jgi:UDP-N-acetylmuramoyl-tripeptide--D-alanyl-D-alanine ligase